MANISKILKKVKMLQPVPSIVHKVLALTDDPDCSIEELIHLVEYDPAVTANLLKMCNSAFLGLPVKVDSVKQAVTMLGMQKVVELILSQNLTGNLIRSQRGGSTTYNFNTYNFTSC